MNFLEKLQTAEFWKNVMKVAVPFFIIFSVIFFIVDQSQTFLNKGFSAAIEQTIAHGKWKTFFGYKLILSFFYGIWMTNKKMR